MMSDMRSNPKKTLGGFEVLAVRDYKEDTRKDLKTGEVTKTGFRLLMFYIMNFLTMHGAVCAHPEQSLSQILLWCQRHFFTGCRGKTGSIKKGSCGRIEK